MTVFEALYNSNTWESAYATLSIHLSREGAQKVIDDHREEKRKEWQQLVDADEDKGTDMAYDVTCPFGEFEDWCIREVKLLP